MLAETTSPDTTLASQETAVVPAVKVPTRESRGLRRARPLFSEQAVASLSRNWYVACKGLVEWLLALVLFLLALPCIILCALLVRLTSRGPAFYSQTRLGRNGVPFRIWKVRTMYHDCEKASGALWSRPGDPRITPVGQFLRRTHLDELPQLWNVLCGEMSLVGPRPERPEFVPSLELAIPHYCDRLLVKPGVTGLAQVHLPADTDLNSVRRKLAYDLFYIRSVNLWLDLRLIVCTAFHMLGVPYRAVCWLFRMPSPEMVEHAYREHTK
jgi:lipopolysaccharide/colanic/teichoic acid biosynthesis glycosyltransferase